MTSTPGPTRSMRGARMKTPWKVPWGVSMSDSNESTCRPNALRRTEMSSAPKLRWSGRPSRISEDSRITPAHVPNTGIPDAILPATASKRPEDSGSCDMVLDSPPGITSACTSRRSAGVRTSQVVAPQRLNESACAANAPCSARTPITGFTWRPRVHRWLTSRARRSAG